MPISPIRIYVGAAFSPASSHDITAGKAILIYERRVLKQNSYKLEDTFSLFTSLSINSLSALTTSLHRPMWAKLTWWLFINCPIRSTIGPEPTLI